MLVTKINCETGHVLWGLAVCEPNVGVTKNGTSTLKLYNKHPSWSLASLSLYEEGCISVNERVNAYG